MRRGHLKKFQEKYGSVEEYLKYSIRKDGSIILSLFDPYTLFRRGISGSECGEVAYIVSEAGVSANMVGGSSGIWEELVDRYSVAIKERVKEKPLIIFPRSPRSISSVPDAIWFMSLLNSRNPYFIIGAQVEGAPLVKKFSIEPIPMGYIIVEPGGRAGEEGEANLILRNEYEKACGYALAAQYLGRRWVYLEAGSGVPEPVPNEMIREVKKIIDIPLGTGGGIRSDEQAREKAASGADYIFIGTRIEELMKDLKNLKITMEEMVEAVREGAKKRKLS